MRASSLVTTTNFGASAAARDRSRSSMSLGRIRSNSSIESPAQAVAKRSASRVMNVRSSGSLAVSSSSAMERSCASCAAPKARSSRPAKPSPMLATVSAAAARASGRPAASLTLVASWSSASESAAYAKPEEYEAFLMMSSTSGGGTHRRSLRTTDGSSPAATASLVDAIARCSASDNGSHQNGSGRTPARTIIDANSTRGAANCGSMRQPAETLAVMSSGLSPIAYAAASAAITAAAATRGLVALATAGTSRRRSVEAGRSGANVRRARSSVHRSASTAALRRAICSSVSVASSCMHSLCRRATEIGRAQAGSNTGPHEAYVSGTAGGHRAERWCQAGHAEAFPNQGLRRCQDPLLRSNAERGGRKTRCFASSRRIDARLQAVCHNNHSQAS